MKQRDDNVVRHLLFVFVRETERQAVTGTYGNLRDSRREWGEMQGQDWTSWTLTPTPEATESGASLWLGQCRGDPIPPLVQHCEIRLDCVQVLLNPLHAEVSKIRWRIITWWTKLVYTTINVPVFRIPFMGVYVCVLVYICVCVHARACMHRFWRYIIVCGSKSKWHWQGQTVISGLIGAPLEAMHCGTFPLTLSIYQQLPVNVISVSPREDALISWNPKRSLSFTVMAIFI